MVGRDALDVNGIRRRDVGCMEYPVNAVLWITRISRIARRCQPQPTNRQSLNQNEFHLRPIRFRVEITDENCMRPIVPMIENHLQLREVNLFFV